MCVLCGVTFYLWCELSDYTVVGIALCPTLTVDMPVTDPVVSQMLFSPSPCVDPLKSGPRIAVIMDLDLLWVLWGQLTLWPVPTPTFTSPQSLQLLRLDLS